jgi:hypothetical protein
MDTLLLAEITTIRERLCAMDSIVDEVNDSFVAAGCMHIIASLLDDETAPFVSGAPW